MGRIIWLLSEKKGGKKGKESLQAEPDISSVEGEGGKKKKGNLLCRHASSRCMETGSEKEGGGEKKKKNDPSIFGLAQWTGSRLGRQRVEHQGVRGPKGEEEREAQSREGP